MWVKRQWCPYRGTQLWESFRILNFAKLTARITRSTYCFVSNCQDLAEELLWVSSWRYMCNTTRHPDVKSVQKAHRQYEVVMSFTFSVKKATVHVTRPFGEHYIWCGSSICSFLLPYATSFPFGPTIFPSTLFSNTLNLCSSLNIRDHVWHPYKTTGKIIFLRVLIFML